MPFDVITGRNLSLNYDFLSDIIQHKQIKSSIMHRQTLEARFLVIQSFVITIISLSGWYYMGLQ